MWISAVFEQLTTDWALISSDSLNLSSSGNTSFHSESPHRPNMDKSVFARVLKVVIQCVEEGSALLHTFKMEGDISNTKITIEFHSYSQSRKSQQPSSRDSSPGAGRGPSNTRASDRKSVDQPQSAARCPPPPVPTRTSSQLSQGSSSDNAVPSDEVVHKPCGCVGDCNCRVQGDQQPDRTSQNIPKPSSDIATAPTGSRLEVTAEVHQPPADTSPGSVRHPTRPPSNPPPPPTQSSSHPQQQHTDHPAKPPDSKKATGKRTHKPGVFLEQVIKDQNKIGTLEERQEEEEEEADSKSWSFDSNQNTVRRKRKPMTKSASVDEPDTSSPRQLDSLTRTQSEVDIPNGKVKSRQPVDQYGEEYGVRPKQTPFGSSQAAYLMSHPSFITRLARMSEHGQSDDRYSQGSSQDDSFDSDESIEMVTDTRQFGSKQKKLKKRKSLITL